MRKTWKVKHKLGKKYGSKKTAKTNLKDLILYQNVIEGLHSKML